MLWLLFPLGLPADPCRGREQQRPDQAQPPFGGGAGALLPQVRFLCGDLLSSERLKLVVSRRSRQFRQTRLGLRGGLCCWR
jgi:hypothetical protein